MGKIWRGAGMEVWQIQKLQCFLMKMFLSSFLLLLEGFLHGAGRDLEPEIPFCSHWRWQRDWPRAVTVHTNQCTYKRRYPNYHSIRRIRWAGWLLSFSSHVLAVAARSLVLNDARPCQQIISVAIIIFRPVIKDPYLPCAAKVRQ